MDVDKAYADLTKGVELLGPVSKNTIGKNIAKDPYGMSLKQ